ncbi:MAG: hypothetical protein K8W52_20970, partial [Deltaproteobacteria bacterium]|nr:hypothetical protein [Deltaproteobacteria bacterium]
LWLAEGHGCVPFVDELMRHPHWQLQIGEAEWSCTWRGFANVFTLSEQDLVWDAPGLAPRHLVLTDGERAALRSWWRLDCGDPETVGGEQFGLLLASMNGLHSGNTTFTDPMDGAPIVRGSPMGTVLESVFLSARARYVAARRAQLGDIRAEIEVKDWRAPWPRPRDRYHATLIGRHLVVRRGARVRARVDLADAQLVDLAEWALAQRDAPAAASERTRGHVDVAGRRTSFGDFDGTWHPLRVLEREGFAVLAADMQ